MKIQVVGALAAYIAVLILIAVWSRRKLRHAAEGEKVEEYFLAGRNLGSIGLVFTIAASQASAATFLGGPALGLEWGYAWVLAGMMQIPSAFLFLGVLGKKFAILGRKLKIVTIPDFLKERYSSRAIVLAASIVIIFFSSAYVAAQLIGGAKVLQSVTGLSYSTVLIVFGLTITLYIGFGGFQADVKTDVVQGTIMAIGGLIVWAAVIAVKGGTGSIGQAVRQDAPDLLTLPGPGNFTIATLVSYWILFGVPVIALPWVAVRCLSFRDSKAMHRAMMAGPILMGIFTLAFIVLGPVSVAFLDPSAELGDLLVPTLIFELVPGWLAGVILAAPLAAMMSTVDSILLILASTVVKDIYIGYINPRMTDRAAAKLSSWGAIGLAVAVTAVALWPPNFLQLLVLFAIGGLEVVVLIPLLLGLYWKRGNTLGTGLSMAGGLATFVALTMWGEDFSVQPVLPGLAVALALYLLGSYVGRGPEHATLVKFWGTHRAIESLQTVEPPG